ncbi:MAG: hypothetical protein IT436_05675 [Phycisphaerales bacterium]|nr:hypothetical protein [Phycisphaerales bacterium]
MRISEAAVILSVAVWAGAAMAQPGLVSRWSAEGTTADSAGPNHGLAQGPVAYQPGIVGQAFLLKSESWIDVPSPVAGGLQSPTGFTIAAWIRADSFVNTASVMNLRTTANASGFTLENLYLAPGTMLFAVNNTGVPEGFATVTSAGWQAGRTYHLAASFDAATGTMRIYRDGDPVASRTDLPHTSMATNPSSLFQIGRNIVANRKWDGQIDEAQVFSRALSPSEVACMVQPGRIARQPVGGALCPGAAVELSIAVRGDLARTYLWRQDGRPIDGAITDTLTVIMTDAGDAGEYDCVVTTDCGTVISEPAVVTYCVVDLNCDGLVDFTDYLEFLNRYDSSDASVDFTQDGLVDFGDYLEFLNLYDAGC